MDQLAALPELRAKRMFGGYGLYQGEYFFGILMDARLYLRTNDQTRTAYLARGMAPFTYEKARRTLTINYFGVPPDVLEDREQFVMWAKQAIEVASARNQRESKAPKRARAKRISQEYLIILVIVERKSSRRDFPAWHSAHDCHDRFDWPLHLG